MIGELAIVRDGSACTSGGVALTDPSCVCGPTQPGGPCWIRNQAGLIVGVRPSCCCIPAGEPGSCAGQPICQCDCSAAPGGCCGNGAEVYLGCSRARMTIAGGIAWSRGTIDTCACAVIETDRGSAGGAAWYEFAVGPCDSQGALLASSQPSAGSGTTYTFQPCGAAQVGNTYTVQARGSWARRASGGFMPGGGAGLTFAGQNTHGVAGNANGSVGITLVSPIAAQYVSGSASWQVAQTNVPGVPALLSGSWAATASVPASHPCGQLGVLVTGSGSGSMEWGPYCFCNGPLTDGEALERVRPRRVVVNGARFEPALSEIQARAQAADPRMARLLEQQMRLGGCRGCGEGYSA